MLELGYVIFQVHPVGADGPGATVNLDFQATVGCQGQVIVYFDAVDHNIAEDIFVILLYQCG